MESIEVVYVSHGRWRARFTDKQNLCGYGWSSNEAIVYLLAMHGEIFTASVETIYDSSLGCWKASVVGSPELWAFGSSSDDATCTLLMAHRKVFGVKDITVDLTGAPKQKLPA